MKNQHECFLNGVSLEKEVLKVALEGTLHGYQSEVVKEDYDKHVMGVQSPHLGTKAGPDPKHTQTIPTNIPVQVQPMSLPNGNLDHHVFILTTFLSLSKPRLSLDNNHNIGHDII